MLQFTKTTRNFVRRSGASLVLAVMVLAGCNPGFNTIDSRVDQLLLGASSNLGEGAPAPQVDEWAHVTVSEEMMDTKHPATWNPSAEDFVYVPTAETDTEEVLARLQGYAIEDENATVFGLQDSLLWAFEYAQEYQYAEEEYVLSCLALLIEQHRWVPRFFDTITPSMNADPDNGFYDTSYSVVNEWNVTQKLPYGGEVSARHLATFSDNLHREVSSSDDPSTFTSEFVLGASIPFLRGAGPVAQESLIQAERNVIYAARKFETFRREFLKKITTEFLGLQVQQRRLVHQESGIFYYDQLSARQQALYEAGRVQFYKTAEAENRSLQAQAGLTREWEQYRLAVDQFKRLIGYDINDPLIISEDALGFEVPVVDMDEAIELAIVNRLDLQTERDQLVDRQRAIRNARNSLLPDLNLVMDAGIPGKGTQGWEGLNPAFKDVEYSAGLSFGLPLDREIERLQVRQAQINLERAQRAFTLFRDTVVIEVRSAVRDIDANLFALDLQRRNVQIAELGMAAIEANPDSASVLSTLESIEQLVAAQDSRDASFRDVQVSILNYLTQSGQLRVQPDGQLELLPGMMLIPYDDLATDEPST